MIFKSNTKTLSTARNCVKKFQNSSLPEQARKRNYLRKMTSHRPFPKPFTVRTVSCACIFDVTKRIFHFYSHLCFTRFSRHLLLSLILSVFFQTTSNTLIMFADVIVTCSLQNQDFGMEVDRFLNKTISDFL